MGYSILPTALFYSTHREFDIRCMMGYRPSVYVGNHSFPMFSQIRPLHLAKFEMWVSNCFTYHFKNRFQDFPPGVMGTFHEKSM